MARTYDDPCGLARALDLVGDRWALLVVRELLLGPKRFTDLRRGLPGASQSMLTARLNELEQGSVVRRRALGPPASVSAYELTPAGQALAPTLIELARWGSRTPITSDAELSVDSLALALRTTFDPEAAGPMRFCCALLLDGDRLVATVEDGRFDVVRSAEAPADAEIECSAATFRRLIFTNPDLDVTMRGDRPQALQLIRLFPRPTPHSP